MIKNEINKIREEIGTNKVKYKVCVVKLSKIVKELQNKKCAGPDQITNEMLKYGCSTNLLSLIKNLMESMIQSGIAPENLNVGKITPIVKNNKESPKAISNAISNLIEKYLNEQLESQITINHKQFGLKKKFFNSSLNLHIERDCESIQKEQYKIVYCSDRCIKSF